MQSLGSPVKDRKTQGCQDDGQTNRSKEGLKNLVDKIENNEGEKKQRNPQVPVLFHEKDDTQ